MSDIGFARALWYTHRYVFQTAETALALKAHIQPIMATPKKQVPLYRRPSSRVATSMPLRRLSPQP